ncbi:histidine phosphatase family protein [Lysinibacillus sphaericus]|uniref:histidine phosphatase family protein n=1 Tax=Lysinibacillus sphaericus TaxID=1421 RepID=UPI0019103FDE|nr:histidine phosphatase family protein [Lysinibacillus sphaericus]QPA52720.1 histidine phosphatase family protein [Lysinibacillus sphaericus]
MKELIIIRHGESEHLANNLSGGWTDLPLTPLGKEQAKKTARAIADYLTTNEEILLFSSDLIRTVETATSINECLKSETIHLIEGLRELNNGEAKGLSKEEAKKIRNPVTEPVIDWVPYSNSESWRMLYERIVNTMELIKEQSKDKTVLLISHSNAMICIINWWLNIKEDHHLANIMYTLDPCSITHLIKDKDGCFTINKLNDTSHLK